MEDEVLQQLEQAQRDIAALEQRLAARDAVDRQTIARLTTERETLTMQVAQAATHESSLAARQGEVLNRLSELRGRKPSMGAMGSFERLVVTGWSSLFIASAMVLIMDCTLMVIGDLVGVGLGLAGLCAAAGWGTAVAFERLRP